MNKQTILVDLDGVLAKYEAWDGVENIGDPIAGAQQFLMDLRNNYQVGIYTTRCSPDFNPGYDSIQLYHFVKKWLDKNQMPYNFISQSRGKPLATAYVDDRAVGCQPQKNRNPHHAYNTALLRVHELALAAEKAGDDNYHEELAKDGVNPDGTSVHKVNSFPCRTCDFSNESCDQCSYEDGDCVELEK